MITTLKSSAKPVTDLLFPAVTICGAGLHMDNVEKVLYNDFQRFLQDQDFHNGTTGGQKELYNKYMKEVFQIKEEGTTDILEILSTMISPSDAASGANAIRKNELACSQRNGRRKKRSTPAGNSVANYSTVSHRQNVDAMSYLFLGSTCEVPGIGSWSSKINEEFILRDADNSWEACAKICRERSTCSHWEFIIGNSGYCVLRTGNFELNGHQTTDFSIYITGYRNCTPGLYLK